MAFSLHHYHQFFENSLFAYNPVSKFWRQISYQKLTNEQEAKQFAQGFLQHCAAVHEDCMYVFGGINETKQTMNSLWKFSFTDLTWTLVPQTNAIAPRLWANAHIYNNKLVIIGGDDFKTQVHFDEICSFDFSSATWETEKCSDVIEYSKTLIIGNDLYIIGGSRPDAMDKQEAKKLGQVIEQISDDVILNILKYLIDSDINAMILVSKNWKVSKVAKRMY